MKFEFATAPRITFGPGTLAEVGPLAAQAGRCALVVTGSQAQRAEPLLAALAAHGVDTVTYPVVGEPAISTVEAGVARGREAQCDLVIALGGGSVIDAGKAMAAMLTNPGEVLDYLEVIGRGRTLPARPAYFIAIPTTAGTGAEVTRNAVLASPAHRVKVSLRSALMLPAVAVIDPTLTLDLPAHLTATTGLDALTQVIEPYVCLRANPLTDGFCEQGLTRVARALRECVFNGRNLEARTDMAVASLMGGLALANAGLGAVHGFAGPIGGMYPAPHGAVCAALLPHVMAANLQALRARAPQHPALGRYQRIAEWLTGRTQASADAGVEWVGQLVADLGIPKLSAYGLTAEAVPEVVAKAAQASSMKPNPVVLTTGELTAVLEAAW